LTYFDIFTKALANTVHILVKVNHTRFLIQHHYHHVSPAPSSHSTVIPLHETMQLFYKLIHKSCY